MTTKRTTPDPAGSTTSSDLDKAAVRGRLDGERSRLAALIADLEAEGMDRETESASIGELAASSQHLADLASETFERERDLGLLESFRGELDEVAAAVDRLDRGTYGVCEHCHQLIPADRLEAVPSTRHCLPCEYRYELGGALLADPAKGPGPETLDENDFLASDDEAESPDDRRLDPEESAIAIYGADPFEHEMLDPDETHELDEFDRDGRFGDDGFDDGRRA